MRIEHKAHRLNEESLALWHATRQTARAMPSKAMQ